MRLERLLEYFDVTTSRDVPSQMKCVPKRGFMVFLNVAQPSPPNLIERITPIDFGVGTVAIKIAHVNEPVEASVDSDIPATVYVVRPVRDIPGGPMGR